MLHPFFNAKETSVNDPGSGVPAPHAKVIKPRWIAIAALTLVVYLLLRPWLVERYGWDLPGFTSVQSTEKSDTTGESRMPRERSRQSNRPIDVPVIPESAESVSQRTPDSASEEDTHEYNAQSNPGRETGSSPAGHSDRTEQDQSSLTKPSSLPDAEPTVARTQPIEPPATKNSTQGKKPNPRGPPTHSTANSPTQKERQPAEGKPSTTQKAPVSNTNDVQKPAWGALTSIGRDRFESTAGLVYNQYRIDHVMEHARDNPDKPTHGIFEVSKQEEVLALIDEAYSIARKKKPPQVAIEDQGDRTTYTVNMNRKIGRSGGQSGARNGHRALNKLKLVLEDDEVITAYPSN